MTIKQLVEKLACLPDKIQALDVDKLVFLVQYFDRIATPLCIHCNGRIVPRHETGRKTHSNKRYCSDRCRSAARRRKQGVPKLEDSSNAPRDIWARG